jgi:hypothetical protein
MQYAATVEFLKNVIPNGRVVRFEFHKDKPAGGFTSNSRMGTKSKI